MPTFKRYNSGTSQWETIVVGKQGPSGIQGTAGTQGTTGTQGTAGNQGLQGFSGTQGTTGTSGIQGIQGFTGSQGTQGINGTQGTTGTQGLQGLQGTIGLQGPSDGAQGTQGIQGEQGLQGPSGGVQGTQGIQGSSGDPVLIQNARTSSYTLVLGDAGKLIEMNLSTANTVTVPTNDAAAFAVGTQINILQVGTGQTTIVADTGVTVNATPGLKFRAQWSSATLIKRDTNTWVAVGDLSSV